MFCHLHTHNEYSVLDGIGTSKQYAKIAKELGQEYLALTNHGNVDGALEHQKQCLEAGISPIAGAEMYLVSDINIKQKGDRRYHITLLVENITGWQNLLKLLTIANIDGFYHRPRIDHKTLLKHIDGLIVMSACSASFIHHPDHKEMLLDYIEAIGKNKVYLEIMPHDIPQQIETNKVAKALSEELNIQMVATNDCHYPTAKSAMHQEVLLAIQTKKKWKDKDRWKFNCDGLFFRSEEEMFKAFQEQGCFTDNEIKRAIRRTVSVAKMCADFRIPQQEIHLPSIKSFAAGEEETFFDNLIEHGIKTRLFGATERRLVLYRQRIGIELNLIKQKGFVRYFLIVWDVLEWCRKNDIMTGPGRGSSGGSLIAYLLYITDCDPLVYHTEFFRFIAEERNDLPDIDMDIEDIRRGDVRKYLCDKYGEFNVSGLSNFLTMKGKGVFRDVCRVFDIPLKEVDYVAKAIISNGKSGNEIEDSFKTERPCVEFEEDYPDIVEICKSLEGQIRGYGQHAAGLCISKNNLREGVNCNLVIRNKELVANWDMRNAEYCGLMKLDLLGLSALTILNETRRLVKQNHGIDLDYKKLPFNDKAVYQEINKGHTCGAFQISTSSLTRYCMELGVDNFHMLYAVTALWRPGPLQSGMTELYSKIKNGKVKRVKIHPLFDKITDETFGVIVYQEQVMKVANQLAGIPMQTCNKIRKIIGKSLGNEALGKYKDEFLEGCKKQKTVTEAKAIQIWDMMSKSGSYSFNLSHSVEYSMITYWDLWAKLYYPNEFIAACLTLGDKTKNVAYMREAKRLRLKVNLPKIGISDATRWNCDTEGNLYAPFITINGVGEPTANKIAAISTVKKARQGFFGAKVQRKYAGIDKTTMDVLTKIKAFEKSYITTEKDLKELKQYFIF